MRDYEGKQVVSDPSNYRLAGSSKHTILIEHYKRIDETQRQQLIDVIISNIDFYLDQVMVFSEGSVTVRKTDREIITDLNKIVEDNIKLYNYVVDEDFPGFSERFEEQVSTIKKLSWNAQKSSESSAQYDAQEMARNYVVARINRIKDESSLELLAFAEEHVHQYVNDEWPLADEEFIDPSDTGEWVRDTPLDPYNYTLEMLEIPDITMFIEPDVIPENIPVGTDKKIIELLEANNRLLDEFAQQMIAMQQQMLELRQEGQAFQSAYQGLRSEIVDLQVAMRDIQSTNQVVIDNPTVKPLDGSRARTIRFEKNSDEISLSYQMELNQIFDILMKDSNRKVMLTGYADISGTPELNATISRKRALAVKRYLKSKGISESRMVVNYMGDVASQSENALDRKVEVAWLVAEN